MRTEERTYNPEIVKRIDDMFEYMLNSHYKSFIVRFDLRYPDGYQVNSQDPHCHLRIFLDEMRKALTRMVKKTKPKLKLNLQYIWKAEIKNSPNHHYHIALMCNSNGLWNLNTVLCHASFYWNKELGLSNPQNHQGLVNSSGQNGINGTVLRNTDHEKKMTLTNWIYYLAKIETSLTNARTFGSSQFNK